MGLRQDFAHLEVLLDLLNLLLADLIQGGTEASVEPVAGFGEVRLLGIPTIMGARSDCEGGSPSTGPNECLCASVWPWSCLA